MESILLLVTILFGTILTFFSGFGLGTLLLPVFCLFFPIEVAVGATGIVHGMNSLFKFIFVYKNIHFPTFLRFSIPAMLFAMLGGKVLSIVSILPNAWSYSLFEKTITVSYIQIIIGFIMLFFAWIELNPKLNQLKIHQKWLPFGGVLSGFFGGISGHQGALRAAFLTKAGLTKEQFIATSNASAVIIDITRLSVYFTTISFVQLVPHQTLILAGIIVAFLGTTIGVRLVKKITLQWIQKLVGYLLIIYGLGLIVGLI
ncbi:MAG: sulfite exporter TauE/SafE family protein [Crocinitomicaceae bacterium]|nr:sulfite exporter TauE/SafE family protein [Crocinitomicaceae bacterium]